jgi:hypothetical protein
MHLKVFVKLKKTLKTFSSGQKKPKNPKKTQKNPKNPKNPKKNKKTHWAGFFKKPGFFPTLPDPDPLVRGMGPDPDPFIILLSSSKNSKKNLDSYCFVTSF